MPIRALASRMDWMLLAEKNWPPDRITPATISSSTTT